MAIRWKWSISEVFLQMSCTHFFDFPQCRGHNPHNLWEKVARAVYFMGGRHYWSLIRICKKKRLIYSTSPFDQPPPPGSSALLIACIKMANLIIKKWSTHGKEWVAVSINIYQCHVMSLYVTWCMAALWYHKWQWRGSASYIWPRFLKLLHRVSLLTVGNFYL